MKSRITRFLHALTILLVFLAAACDRSADEQGPAANAPGRPFQCDPDNGGLILPAGFCAAIVADNLGFVRHIAVNDNGDIYVTIRNQSLHLGGLLALRDDNGDGLADIIRRFSDEPGMGIGFHAGYLYFAADHALYRYQLDPGELIPAGPPEIVVTGFPEQILHAGKTFAIDPGGLIYINIGAPSNACQTQDLIPKAKGMEPCPQLDSYGGIWRFDAGRTGQSFQNDGYRYASGIRNAYAIDWNSNANRLYVVQHGRDQLHGLWPELFSQEMDARLPAEEFLLVEEGGEYSWPYCYYDQMKNIRLLSPEYGGDGIATGQCDRFPEPLIAFPGHYGPNDLIFYHADQFPEHYRHGAFIAFHNAYSGNGDERTGYQVVFVAFAGDKPAGDWEVFADSFAGGARTNAAEDTDHRPTGLALGADGSLYISDSVQGRIWRVIYRPRTRTKD